MQRLLAVVRRPQIESHDPFTKPIKETDAGEQLLSEVA